MIVESAGEAAVRALLRSFSPRTGRWRTPTGDAWQPALALEAVLLAYEKTRAPVLLHVVEKTFSRYRGRRSRFFDDDGWYLNGWLRAYDVTGDPKYLAESLALFESMAQGWDDHCGGGLWWSADRTYKNAITNELFLLAAARLARRTESPHFEVWARKSWQWFEASGMINGDDLVNDGLNSSCHNNGQPTWSYNQGVILGGLAELSRLTGDPAPFGRACRIAAAAMGAIVHSGHSVVCEPGGDAPAFANRDAHAFKGVFAQGLARLHAAARAADPPFAAAIRAFLEANADAVWRGGAGDFGMSWLEGAGLAGGLGSRTASGPVNAATRASAALLLCAVELMESGGETDEVPPLGGIRYEAERASLIGIGTESMYQGFSGTGYVAGWRGDGQAVVFTVDGDGEAVRVDLDGAPPGGYGPVESASSPSRTAATATATLRYAAGAGDAYRLVLVDGMVVADRVLFVDTGSWETYETVSLRVRLRLGSVVEVRFDESQDSRNYLNLDSMTVLVPKDAAT